jgi:hypothetical protein
MMNSAFYSRLGRQTNGGVRTRSLIIDVAFISHSEVRVVVPV